MAIKDWKEDIQRDLYWLNKKKHGVLYIHKDIYNLGVNADWVVWWYYREWPNDVGSASKSFKSKSKALAFAKQYMKKH